MDKLLIGVRVIHAVSLAIVPIAVLILVFLPILGFDPLSSSGDPILEITMGGFSTICLILGFSWPRLFGWHKSTKSELEVPFGHVGRLSLFECLVIFGLVLKIFGSGWLTVLPFFILAVIALALTFPTKKRLTEWQRGKPNTKGN
jgi:hypothetical protein